MISIEHRQKLWDLAQHLRSGDWNLRTPQELADMMAARIEGILLDERKAEEEDILCDDT